MRQNASYDAIVRVETAISTAVYALVPTAVLWLVGASAPATLFGANTVLPALLLPAGVGTLMMTLALTAIIRGRVRRGSLPSFAGVPGRGRPRFVPAALPWRALVLAAAAVVLFVPVGLAVIALLGVLPLSTTGFVIFNIVYGACIGPVVTPPVVRAALAD